MTAALRHSCRYCRTKLIEPTDNPRRGFCCRGCHRSFYRSRCVVCETQFRRKNERQRTCIDVRCKADLRRFPEAYSWPEKQITGNHPSDVGGALETLAKWASKSATRPAHRCLRTWSWTEEVDCELELHDQAGKLLARLEHSGGRYRLTHPCTIPILSWPGEDMAKHRAESIALNSLPLDAATAARVTRDNSKPHPMARPA